MKTLFIVNPVSGTAGRRKKVIPAIESFIQRHSWDAEIAQTGHPGHAREIAHSAVSRGVELLVAAGGDGTINEVACSAHTSGLTIGILPCGSGDGLARHLKIPRDITAALEVLRTGKAMDIDVGTANGTLFVNVMGIGFDAELAQRFNALKRRGLAGYMWTGTAGFLKHRAGSYRLENGSKSAGLSAMLIAVANASQYGNNAIIAPKACISDGKLNLVCLPPVRFSRLPSTARHIFLGSIDRIRDVVCWQGAKFTIQRSLPGIIHTDGEVHHTTATVTIEVLPAALRVMVP